MKKQTSKYYILLLLAIMFAAPGIAAYFFYQHPDWLSSPRVNKGTLLSPPVALNSLAEQTKWRIVFFSPEPCKKACLEQLNMLARVRLALGRKLYLVDEWLVLDEKSTQSAEEIRPLLKEQDVHVTTLSPEDSAKLITFPNETRVFISNPDNYLILSYKMGGNLDDIYKDLKLLLNTAENKNGPINAK